jgi:hypothetical protein
MTTVVVRLYYGTRDGIVARNQHPQQRPPILRLVRALQRTSGI